MPWLDMFRLNVVWSAMFQTYGCIICESKANFHAGWGFCLPCSEKMLSRIRELDADD